MHIHIHPHTHPLLDEVRSRKASITQEDLDGAAVRTDMEVWVPDKERVWVQGKVTQQIGRAQLLVRVAHRLASAGRLDASLLSSMLRVGNEALIVDISSQLLAATCARVEWASNSMGVRPSVVVAATLGSCLACCCAAFCYCRRHRRRIRSAMQRRSSASDVATGGVKDR